MGVGEKIVARTLACVSATATPFPAFLGHHCTVKHLAGGLELPGETVPTGSGLGLLVIEALDFQRRR